MEPKVKNVETQKGTQQEQYKNTPFTMVKLGETWSIVVGNQVASSEKFKTKKAAAEYIESKPWELILITQAIILNKWTETQKNQ